MKRLVPIVANWPTPDEWATDINLRTLSLEAKGLLVCMWANGFLTWHSDPGWFVHLGCGPLGLTVTGLSRVIGHDPTQIKAIMAELEQELIVKPAPRETGSERTVNQ